MSELLLHPQTAQALQAFQGHPSHAVVLGGPAGSGKFSLARQLAETALALQPGKLETYPYSKILQPVDGKAISIEAVRELEHFLSLKVPGAHSPNRAIIIADAHLLTTEAQNALLKTIEEPPAGTILILTVAHEQTLLPTIRSRVQKIVIKRPEPATLRRYFVEQGFAEAAVKRAVAMSGGLPGLTQALLQDADHPLLPAALKARELLSQSTFERLTQVDGLAQQRSLCLDTLFMMQQMALISLPTAPAAMARRWQTVLLTSQQAADALLSGGQPKLVLCNFLLQL